MPSLRSAPADGVEHRSEIQSDETRDLAEGTEVEARLWRRFSFVLQQALSPRTRHRHHYLYRQRSDVCGIQQLGLQGSVPVQAHYTEGRTRSRDENEVGDRNGDGDGNNDRDVAGAGAETGERAGTETRAGAETGTKTAGGGEGYELGNSPRRRIIPPVLSTCPLHTNSGCGKERRISIGPW